MVRETRGAANKEAAIVDSTPSNKRKRRPSDLPSSDATPASVPSLKVVLPSPSSVGAPGKSTTIHISPSKLANGNGASHSTENGEGEGSVKKQRISLKISGKANGARGRSKSKSPGLEEVAEDQMDVVQAGGEVKDEKREGMVMPPEMRIALGDIITKMSEALPPPHNSILQTPLPPAHSTAPREAKSKPPTLETVLQSEDLTWEHLITTLHDLSAHLLAPSRYPNPLPSLSQLNVPIPPLPAPYVPFPLWRFFHTLRRILISIQPSSPAAASAEEQKVERWALLQKGVQHGPSGPMAVEWWSSLVSLQETQRALDQIKGEGKEVEGGLMGYLAGLGGMFGNAIPVAIHDTVAGPSQAKGPKLNDSLMRKASHKAARWKEELAKRRKGGFGSVQVPVRALKRPETDFSWTPSFSPSFDSLYASGGAGYYNTLDGMHQRALAREWRAREHAVEEVEKGWQGILPPRSIKATDGSVGGGERDVEEMLRDNADHLEELEAWQLHRMRQGSTGTQVGERENVLAEEVLSSLTSLASSSSPSTLLTTPLSPGAAHNWSSRFVSPTLPAQRGTLDPRRPKGIKDNSTARFNARPPSLTPAQPSTPGSMSGPPPSGNNMGGRPYGPGTPGYSSSTPVAGAYRRPVGRPPSTGPGSSAAQTPGYYTPPNPSNPFSRPGGYGGGNTIYNRPGAAPSPGPPINYNNLPGGPSPALNSLARPQGMAGPSGLRQSYGPTTATPGRSAYTQGGMASVSGMMGRPPMSSPMH